MPIKKIVVISIENGIEHYIELIDNQFRNFRLSIMKEFNKDSILIIDEEGKPILTESQYDPARTTYYVASEDSKPDSKTINSKGLIGFHKASAKFLMGSAKEASSIIVILKDKYSSLKAKAEAGLIERDKIKVQIKTLPQLNDFFNSDNTNTMRVQFKKCCSELEELNSITTIINDFTKNVTLFVTKANVIIIIRKELEKANSRLSASTL